ncbi:nuclear transport factor 2 family protein [Sphaerisporangium aureirubrum]|uniref:Nuclear transport factor 2 family protein n=1 Tax=Sphaerisporangium aureirubrum TaxID=1544736 RepID=A0ABW1NCQ1_9ACTN
MSEHPNAVLARESYDALINGDFDHLRGTLLSDDVVFHVPGRGPLAGEYQGKEAVLSYLGQLSEITKDTMSYEPQAFLADDEHAAVMLRAHGERGGHAIDDRGVHVFRITDGKISERWSYPQDSYAVDEFFG